MERALWNIAFYSLGLATGMWVTLVIVLALRGEATT